MLSVREVRGTQTNINIFRSIARDTCGESMQPTTEEKIFFGYGYGSPKSHKQDTIQAVASVKLANLSSDINQHTYCHWLTFLFVKKDFQYAGVGSSMLHFIQNYLWTFMTRPIRTDSARKAVGFFRKNGFTALGSNFQCVCPGGSLFNTLQTLEKAPPADMVESWD